MAPRDVFISHSSGDAESARELRVVLEDAGYSCWMAPDDIIGTETWTEQILAAIADSKVMVVLVSAAANASPHVSREVNLALGRKRAVLPIRIESVAPEGPLEYLLSLVQRLDAFPPPMAGHGPRILRRLESIVQRPETTPLPAPGPDTSPAPAPDSKGPETGPMDASAPAPDAPDVPREKPKPRPRSKPKAGDTTRRPSEETSADPPPRRHRSSAELGAGSVVGPFTIESQLGEGGMATVFRARQDEPRRLVALKVIRADHAANDTYRARFLEEKETLAALEHPSIVPIYAAGESDGVLFIAMRLVDGPDLQARIKSKGFLSLRETVQILEPIADAVDYAHEMGVVHRDLKPSNIILDRDARPYLTDFGLGKRLEVDSQLSMPGMAIGTLDYMAPEQFKGNSDPKLAPAIDLYALGCVAFQCLTGQAPFVRGSTNELMYAHANEPPPKATSLRPEYPPVIDGIFEKVLAKDPAARFGSAREFISNLESVVNASATGTTSPVVVTTGSTPAAKARSWVGGNTALAVAGAAVALIAVVVIAASAIFGPGTEPTPTLTATVDATRTPTERPPTAPPPTEPPPTLPPPSAPPSQPPDFPNGAETYLLDIQPATLVDVSTCTRYAPGIEGAVATIACFGPEGAARQVLFATFDTNVEMDAAYDDILAFVGLEATETGCFDLVSSNNSWSYVGTDTNAEGRLACYPWTDGDFDGIEYVWTHTERLILGLWITTDYQAGLDYFDAWVTAVKP